MKYIFIEIDDMVVPSSRIPNTVFEKVTLGQSIFGIMPVLTFR
jgi:hypothetical protein